MRVIGLGGNETQAAAEKFVTRNKIKSFPMLWDETGAAWASFRIPSNPGAVFLDASGKIVKVWFGQVPKNEQILAMV